MGALYCMVAGWLEGSIGFDLWRRRKKEGRGGRGWGMDEEGEEDDSARLK